jgi:hypothetical protein
LFFLFILISFFFKYEWLPELSGTWQSRDIIVLLGSIIISIFLLETNKKIYYIFLSILLINNFLLTIESTNHLKKHGQFKIDNISQSNSKFFNDLNIDKKNFQRIYLSPKIFDEVNSQSNSFFIENNVYRLNDFIKYNLYPINYIIKNQKNSLREVKLKMYTIVDSNFSEINNSEFLNLFLIDFILAKKEELNMIDKKKFFIKTLVDVDNEKYVLLEKKDKQYLILNNQDIKNINYSNCNNSENKAACFLDKKFFSNNKNIYFKKINHDSFLVENHNDYDVNFILPFMDADFKVKKKNNITALNKNFSSIFLKARTVQELKTENIIKQRLRLLSFLFLIFLLLLILFYKKLKFKK